MKHSRVLPLLLALMAQRGLHAAETVTSAAGSSFASVQEAGSARAVALGSTYVGIAEGSQTLPWNPAGLSGLCAPELSLHHNSTLLGSFQESAIFAMPVNPNNGFGASVNFTDNGTFEGRDDNGVKVGDY